MPVRAWKLKQCPVRPITPSLYLRFEPLSNAVSLRLSRVKLIVASNACGYPFATNCLLGQRPKPLLNTEFHSVAARSANAFLSVPGTPFRGIGVRESLTPFANIYCPKIELSLGNEVAKYHPIRNTFQ